MTFDWPWALLVLAAVPIVLGIAWWSRRRRRRAAVRVTSAVLVRNALPGRTQWRRRIPAALLVLGLLVLAVGAARPQADVKVSTNSTTIMLALDVSGSMCSTDVAPNRITAAEKAATNFIHAQPSGTRMGLVAFSSVAAEIVPPTNDTSKLVAAMKTLTTSRGTAIGEGILTSIDAIAEVDPSVAPTGATVTAHAGSGYAADTIVLLTDGANNAGVDPQTAAKEAAARRIRVYTIGFGTTMPAPLECDDSQLGGGFSGNFGNGGTGSFGYGGGRDGGANPFYIDENALKQVAAATGGQYYRAMNASALDSALKHLPSTITVAHKRVDLADSFAGIGGLFVAVAIGLSLWWNRVRRPVPRGDPPA
jgi:Ca-activated chloride channel family protein